MIKTILAVMLLCFCSLISAKTYLWYDDNGQAIFSNSPPKDGRATKEIKPPPPPSSSSETEQKALQSQLQYFEDRKEDKRLRAEKQNKADGNKEDLAKDCSRAKANLQELQQKARHRIKGSDGEMKMMTPKEKDAQLERMRKIMKASC